MTQEKASAKTGVFIIGAHGDIAVTLLVGALAIRHRHAAPLGMVSDLAAFSSLGLVPLEQLRFGGIDVRSGRLREVARTVGDASRTFSRDLLDCVAPTLDAIDADVHCDDRYDWNTLNPAYASDTLADVVELMRRQLQRFRRRHELARIVVLDLASVEATPGSVIAHTEPRAFAAAVADDDRRVLSPSMIRAYAAFLEECAYVNFTPNAGAEIPALQALAIERGLPFYGSDAKTGETLIKSVLAPMFALRNLEVMSWEGVNMLGNNDGKALDDPDRRKAKIGNKEELVPRLLGYPVHSGVDINYVPSLGDWKTAWDLIHFKGFLDVPMTMQFTWQGCDSILAAPLALDLIRFGDFAMRKQESGPMKHLASFFKSPVGVEELAFMPQFELLLRYAQDHAQRGGHNRSQQESA
jgi:myo-inositol-1-phosphate synthase